MRIFAGFLSRAKTFANEPPIWPLDNQVQWCTWEPFDLSQQRLNEPVESGLGLRFCAWGLSGSATNQATTQSNNTASMAVARQRLLPFWSRIPKSRS
jgi:hypothetical protein